MKNILILSIASILILSGMLAVATIPPPGWESELIAGQNWVAGNLEVTHEYGDRYLYIMYTTADGWIINDTHLAVAVSFNDIPQTQTGNPKVGKFPYTNPAISEPTFVEYIIDLDDFPGLQQNEYTGTLVIAAHAIVYNPMYGEQTAWADTISEPFPGNNWALYFTITL